MTSIKVKFRPSATTDKEGSIYYQIIHERKRRTLLSDHRVLCSEWDERRSTVIASAGSDRKAVVGRVRDHIRRDMERLTKIVRRLDEDGLAYTADDVVDEYIRYGHEYSLTRFMERLILSLKQNGRVRTAETYAVTLNSFRKFLTETKRHLRFGDEDIMLDSLNAETMEAYEAWHHQRGVVPNTSSFYLRILRAVYNRAVEDEAIENLYPFRRVYTGVDKTVKRALPLSVIKRIRGMDLSRHPALDFARDMFVMSFMLRGMSFVDMAFLRKKDLAKGYVTYRRRKTGQHLSIKWTQEMQAILDKYPANRSDYLLPIIRNPGTNERYTYRNVGYNINRNLKLLARQAGIEIPLTLYVARHSWASAAKTKGIPLSVISEGMGHDSESTTQIYLASLDTAVVDRANSLILQSI